MTLRERLNIALNQSVLFFKGMQSFVTSRFNIKTLLTRLSSPKNQTPTNPATNSSTGSINSSPKNNKPILDSFEADLDDVTAGTKVTLTWKGSRIETLFLNGEAIQRNKQKIVVSPLQNTKYTLVAKNSFGQTQLIKKIIVGHPPTINDFSTLEEIPFFIEGELIKFNWDIKGAKELHLICKLKEGNEESINVSSRKEFYKTFKRDAEVFLLAINKYGTSKSSIIKLRIAPNPEYDKKIPFPDIMLTQIIPPPLAQFNFHIKEDNLIPSFPQETLNLSIIDLMPK